MDTGISVEKLNNAKPALNGEENTAAARDVLAERRRQIVVEGWTAEHDDANQIGELATAAGCYAVYSESCPETGNPPARWPFHKNWWKPSKDTRRNLVKAGALILAEIERLDRLAANPRTITVNGIEVPEPLRKAPKEGTVFYAVELSDFDGVRRHKWAHDNALFKLLLPRGLLHLPESAAYTHLEALLKPSRRTE
jgi:hypothetical protein